jgi:hypothetical protein
MAISPWKSEEIAFEHPYFLVVMHMVQCTMSRKCNERRSSCRTRNWLALAAYCALAACAPKAAGPAPATAPEPAVVGGWQVADPRNEDIQAAARYAAGMVRAGNGGTAEVTSAETQVVAGINIRMVLRLADGSHWKATVWRRLDGTFALTEVGPQP